MDEEIRSQISIRVTIQALELILLWNFSRKPYNDSSSEGYINKMKEIESDEKDFQLPS